MVALLLNQGLCIGVDKISCLAVICAGLQIITLFVFNVNVNALFYNPQLVPTRITSMRSVAAIVLLIAAASH